MPGSQASILSFPEQAATAAGRVDAFFLFMLWICGLMSLLVAVLIIYFSVRYRRRTEPLPTPRILGSTRLELFWTIGPFFIFVLMFWWGAVIYFAMARPPDDAMEIYVVGKQWMWKIQHPEGQ